MSNRGLMDMQHRLSLVESKAREQYTDLGQLTSCQTSDKSAWWSQGGHLTH